MSRHRGPKSHMTVTMAVTGRVGFYCPCCQTPPGEDRKRERRRIKRSERQAWKKEAFSVDPQ